MLPLPVFFGKSGTDADIIPDTSAAASLPEPAVFTGCPKWKNLRLL
ncbi:MAG: hypothetical protein LBG74_03790 [Spirochaetaceae bacterium]|nr:hypothetical protein [Spirochaetaceae bacterium]